MEPKRREFCRKGRSEKTLGSEKTLSQMTSHERRKTVARAPRNRRICAQMRSICDAQCHICARRMPHLRRTMPHLRRTMPHLRAQNATSATPPCAICDASMCDLHRVQLTTLDARCSGGRPLPLPRGCGGLARPLAVHCYAPLTASSACRPLAGCVCAAGCRPPHARLATHASCADDVLSSRVLECCAVCLSVWRHRFLDMWLHHLIPPFAASVCI